MWVARRWHSHASQVCRVRAELKTGMRILHAERVGLAAALIGSSAAISSSSFANGLEAPVSASSEHAGIGGAACSSADDQNALVINPAGLARVTGLSATLSVMPVLTHSSAPVAGPNVASDGRTVAPLGELLVAWSPVPGLGLAVGFNATGGMGGNYGAVDFGNFAMQPVVSQALGSVEASLGGGLRLTDHLTVGAAWR